MAEKDRDLLAFANLYDDSVLKQSMTLHNLVDIVDSLQAQVQALGGVINPALTEKLAEVRVNLTDATAQYSVENYFGGTGPVASKIRERVCMDELLSGQRSYLQEKRAGALMMKYFIFERETDRQAIQLTKQFLQDVTNYFLGKKLLPKPGSFPISAKADPIFYQENLLFLQDVDAYLPVTATLILAGDLPSGVRVRFKADQAGDCKLSYFHPGESEWMDVGMDYILKGTREVLRESYLRLMRLLNIKERISEEDLSIMRSTALMTAGALFEKPEALKMLIDETMEFYVDEFGQTILKIDEGYLGDVVFKRSPNGSMDFGIYQVVDEVVTRKPINSMTIHARQTLLLKLNSVLLEMAERMKRVLQREARKAPVKKLPTPTHLPVPTVQ